ncbi:MAG: helix-turn-helix domain-containing protein [Lachnospiraceae bacterium]
MDNAAFGKFIRASRKEQGLTQKQLADLLHVSDKTVSKWENGAGFPDIKLLEPLASSLGVSLLELMQSERVSEAKVDRSDAEQAVAETISRSEQAEERKRLMWKVKLLLGACACGTLYLVWTGICYLYDGGEKMRVNEGAWYGNPVTFYVWAGLLVILCGAAAVYMLWKDERLSEVKIGRHKIKGALTILMDMLVVLLLHTYLSGIANNQEQLTRLPELLPIQAFLSTPDGSRQAGLFIREEVVDGLQDSGHVKDLKLTVRMEAESGALSAGGEKKTELYLEGVNCLAALGNIEETDIVWNKGESAAFLQETAAKCVVSQELMEQNSWKLGEQITLGQYYYVREDERYMWTQLLPLETAVYEIAGYADLQQTKLDTFMVFPDVVIPFETVREAFHRQELPFFADSASFYVADSLELNEFKQEMRDLSLRGASPFTQDYSLNGDALNLNDVVFINAATYLRRVIDVVRAFFPFVLILIVCVGYLVTLLLLQSRRNEMALLRSLGLGKWKCFRIFFTEQLVLVVTGIVAGSVLSVLIQGNYGGSSVLTGCLVGVFYMLGNSLALWKLMQVSVMEALFQTE